MDKSSIIFLAGHNGLVGSAILKKLKKANYRNIITVDRKKLDLRNYKKLSTFFKKKKVDYLIMAAARAGGILANSKYQKDFFLENIEIQNNLLNLALKKKIKRTIFLGTSCIYPKFSKNPIKEEYLLTGKLEKTNQAYAIAKIAGIKLCEALRCQHGFDAISLMPTNLYGPGDNYHPDGSHVLPGMIRRFHQAKQDAARSVSCWGTGTPLREFLHADDLGEACVFALEHWSALSEEVSPWWATCNGVAGAPARHGVATAAIPSRPPNARAARRGRAGLANPRLAKAGLRLSMSLDGLRPELDSEGPIVTRCGR